MIDRPRRSATPCSKPRSTTKVFPFPTIAQMKEVERHWAVVNVAKDEVVPGGPVKVRVADRVDLVRFGRHPIWHNSYLVLDCGLLPGRCWLTNPTPSA